jgi:threonine/homoserine/homoserine lactone efflux protein
MNEILRNILLGISLAAPLGPASVAVIQNGLKQGFQRAFLTGVGVTLADTTYLMLVFFGLSSFIDAPLVKVLIWVFGSMVLVYLGIQGLREGTDNFVLDVDDRPSSKNPLLAGYLINISNPLAVIWWLGIFGSILSSAAIGGSRTSALLVSSSILAGILMWHSFMALLTHWGKRFLNQTTIRGINILAGTVLILFGLRLAYLAISTMTAF